MTADGMPHGTENCYVNRGCRLPECREAHRVARGRREMLRQRGYVARVPAADVLPVFESLLARGWSVHQITNEIGGGRDLLRRVRAGSYVTQRTATALRDLADRDLEAGLIPADLTMRRVQSLYAHGWTSTDIRRAAGLAVASARNDAFRRSKPYVYPDTARGIREAYRQLADTPGPCNRNRGRARARGWPVPAAWDDPGTLAWPTGQQPAPDDTDDGHDVDEVAVRRWLTGDRTITLNDAEKTEAARIGLRAGMSQSELIRRLHWSGKTWYKRMGHTTETPATRTG